MNQGGLNDRLRVAREEKRWSQQEVATRIGVTCRSIIRWEQGQCYPYKHYVYRLCKLFEKSQQELGLIPSPRSRECEPHIQGMMASQAPAEDQYEGGHPLIKLLREIDEIIKNSLLELALIY